MDEFISVEEAARAQERINRMKTIGMNHFALEKEFIEQNKHCHLCSADMAGPCAFPFREWMACASALDMSDKADPHATPQLNHPQCQRVLNQYINCCNSYMIEHAEQNSLGKFPWFLWAQRSQMLFSPCSEACKDFNPFAGRFQYLLHSSAQKCNQCLVKNINYPWHMFTRTRMEDVYVWKILTEKIDVAEAVLKEATNRGWY